MKQGSLFGARAMHLAGRISAIGINAECQQHDTSGNLQVPAILLVIDKIHHITHAIPSDACIDDIAQGSTYSCDKTIPSALVQRALHAKHSHRSHRCRSYDSYEHPLEHKIKYVDLKLKRHNKCKGGKLL